MKTALFVVDQRHESGRGHIVRCSALAEELRSRGWEVDYSDSRGFPTADDLPEHNVMVVDDYNLTREWIEQAVAYSPFVVVADDYQPERVYGGVGIVVNGSASGASVAYAPSIRALLGPRYALLRKEFSHFSPSRFERRGVLDMTQVRGLSGFHMATVVGRSLWSISYGGMSALESVAVGTPVLLSPRVDRESSESANRDALVYAGCAEWFGAEDRDDMSAWDRMHERCLMLTDGMGCQRVADTIEEYV
jgi:spore coat polysaccharide biosynthesis predicted glycosyltransferase SpsG